MKRITFLAGSKLFRWIVTLVLVGTTVPALKAAPSTRPAYGGILRVQMSEHIVTIDPRLWPVDSQHAAAVERMSSLVFDRLVRLDGGGLPQPALAISWQHDAQSKRWQFLMRKGVKFSDGAPLTRKRPRLQFNSCSAMLLM